MRLVVIYLLYFATICLSDSPQYSVSKRKQFFQHLSELPLNRNPALIPFFFPTTHIVRKIYRLPSKKQIQYGNSGLVNIAQLGSHGTTHGAYETKGASLLSNKFKELRLEGKSADIPLEPEKSLKEGTKLMRLERILGTNRNQAERDGSCETELLALSKKCKLDRQKIVDFWNQVLSIYDIRIITAKDIGRIQELYKIFKILVEIIGTNEFYEKPLDTIINEINMKLSHAKRLFKAHKPHIMYNSLNPQLIYSSETKKIRKPKFPYSINSNQVSYTTNDEYSSDTDTSTLPASNPVMYPYSLDYLGPDRTPWNNYNNWPKSPELDSNVQNIETMTNKITAPQNWQTIEDITENKHQFPDSQTPLYGMHNWGGLDLYNYTQKLHQLPALNNAKKWSNENTPLQFVKNAEMLTKSKYPHPGYGINTHLWNNVLLHNNINDGPNSHELDSSDIHTLESQFPEKNQNILQYEPIYPDYKNTNYGGDKKHWIPAYLYNNIQDGPQKLRDSDIHTPIQLEKKLTNKFTNSQFSGENRNILQNELQFPESKISVKNDLDRHPMPHLGTEAKSNEFIIDNTSKSPLEFEYSERNPLLSNSIASASLDKLLMTGRSKGPLDKYSSDESDLKSAAKSIFINSLLNLFDHLNNKSNVTDQEIENFTLDLLVKIVPVVLNKPVSECDVKEYSDLLKIIQKGINNIVIKHCEAKKNENAVVVSRTSIEQDPEVVQTLKDLSIQKQ